MFFPDTMLFILSMILTGLLVFLLVYFIITLSDLECDYINAQTCCYRLNMWTIPKLAAQIILTFLLLVHGHMWLFAANLPILGWTAYELVRVPKGNVGVYDPTEIHNRGQLKIHMRDVLIHVAFHLVAFFVYMYSMIISMLKSDPISPTAKPNEMGEF